MIRKHWTLIVPGAVLLCATPALAVDLREAVQAALNSNPDIRQAVANKAATQAERRQAEGLWLPRISVEASAGVRELRNPTRRSLGIANQRLEPVEGILIADQLLFDMANAAPRSVARHRALTPPRPASKSGANLSRSMSAVPTSTICCNSGWWRSRRTMRLSMNGSPAIFAKA